MFLNSFKTNIGLALSFCCCVSICLASCKTPVKKEIPPDEQRFKRVVLAGEAAGLSGATEFDIAKDGKIYLVDLSGHLQVFNTESKLMKSAGAFDGGEFGLIGIKLDPKFDVNSFIYLQYFKVDTTNASSGRGYRIMHISRFTMVNDSVDRSSEKNYLKIPYEDACCHTGGGMDFDAAGNLYISTGDNTDAFYTQYSPVVDIPGQDVIHDGLRSAGNTNDLRGKILRIHPEQDGTFSTPDGNLFPKGTAKTKPEIYIMGVRNPYRLTIDRKTNFLCWGEVGPDAANDSSAGPRGYDEFNIAREAGNFGWPLVIGNNKPYPRIFHNENKRIGNNADTLHPVNYSVNNTGLINLPPVQAPLIWYPYDSSAIFQSFGAGGRTAIGGPFYQYDESLDSKVKFPEWFNHCWFIGDWMRNWIKVVRLNDNNSFETIEDFMPNTLFRKPICMKFGPDGALYILEFGSTWGDNPDARLVKIEYQAGNRAPVARLKADKVFGKTPLTVQLSADKSIDYDNDPLEFKWKDSTGNTIAHGANTQLTFDKPGRYRIRLTVKDIHGAETSTDTIISSGNSMPDIKILTANQTFYWDTLTYAVQVKDEEDGGIGNGISDDAIKVSLRYVESPYGYKIATGLKQFRGEVLLNESDCKSCHQLNAKSAGPTFTDIAQRYNNNQNEILRLSEKIIRGGSGVWGKTNMSAHPQLNIEQAVEIVRYIFSLSQKNYPSKSVSPHGSLSLKDHPGTNGGYYVLSAAYRDKGGLYASSLTARDSISFRNPKISADDFEDVYEGRVNDGKFSGHHGSSVAIHQVDMTGVNKIELLASGNGRIDIHLDSANGPVLKKALFTEKHKEEIILASIKSVTGLHSVYFVFTSEDERFSEIYMRWVRFGK